MGCKVTNASDMTINSNLELLYEKNPAVEQLNILRSELIPLITGYSIIVDVAFYIFSGGGTSTNRIDYDCSYDVNELIKTIEIARKSYEYFGEEYTNMEVRPFIGRASTNFYCAYDPTTDTIRFYHSTGYSIKKRAFYGIK